MAKGEKRKDLGPVGQALLVLAAQLNQRASEYDAGDTPAGTVDFGDGLREAAKLIEEFARS